MIIVGISALYHDSACAIFVDGRLVAAAHEERFTRRRYDARMPVSAFRFCLRQAGVSIHQVDCVAYYEQPADKLARQLWSGFPEHPVGRRSALFRLDADRPRREIREILGYAGPIEFVSHHEAHAASAFYCSGFDRAALFVADAVGEWTTTSYGRAGPDGVELFEQVRFPHSLGLLYSAVTNFLGFDVNSDEYKVMGLAPYGKPRFDAAFESLISLKPAGQFELDLRYFDFRSDRRMYTPELAELLGTEPREPGDEPLEVHADIAASLQALLEFVLLAKISYLHEQVGGDRLCYAGGVALNCVANGMLRRLGPFADIFIQPAAGDAGAAIGAAALVQHRRTGTAPARRRLTDARLGSPIRDDEIEALVSDAGIEATGFGADPDGLVSRVASRLSEGAIVGWVQGRAEFGPRALGGRSILADPRDPGMRDRINALVKKREAFRPFAPMVAAQRCGEFFDTDVPSPFMLDTCQVRDAGKLPAVTHVDGSARVQTVDRAADPRLHALLTEFGRLTGYPILLNTSFNMRGEPIVDSASDALACFVRSGLDLLVVGDLVIERADLPARLADRLDGVDPYQQPSISESVYTFF